MTTGTQNLMNEESKNHKKSHVPYIHMLHYRELEVGEVIHLGQL